MQAGGSQSCGRQSLPNVLIVFALVGAAVPTLILMPEGSGAARPGDLVSYSEDRIGRPWKVVRQHEYGRYVIRNGRVYTIAGPGEIGPYDGLAKNVTVQLAGLPWRDKVQQIRRQQQSQQQIATSQAR